MCQVSTNAIDGDVSYYLVLSSLRWFIFEVVVNAFGMLFLEQALSPWALARATVYASLWAAFYTSASVSMKGCRPIKQRTTLMLTMLPCLLACLLVGWGGKPLC